MNCSSECTTEYIIACKGGTLTDYCNVCRASLVLRVSVKPGLWTGLDYGLDYWLDWTVDWTGLTKTAVYRQQMPPRLQKLVPNSASSCFLAVESSRHHLLDSERSKVTCIFNKLHKGGSGRLMGSAKVRPSMTCIYCFLWRPHASAGKAPSPIFDWALVRTLCSLEVLEEQLFWTETTLQPLCSKQARFSVSHDHSWSSFLLIKYARDLWPHRNWGTNASTG